MGACPISPNIRASIDARSLTGREFDRQSALRGVTDDGRGLKLKAISASVIEYE